MKYRSDIDGLRALAVLSVVLFHFDYLDGGFVGVDIFFVISGFLITKLIHDGVSAGSFSIADFYVRRIRRILPALVAVYLATLAFALFFTFSFEAGYIGKTLLSSVFFVSNIFFYRDTGYFNDGSTVNPLLHTWSLSVEEQFYIVLPLLMIGLGHLSARKRYLALGGIAAVSFAASVWMVQKDAPAAFYLMQYRAWEFLFGSLIAVGAVPALKRQSLADAAGLAGLALVIGSVALMSKSVPFPGLGALTPVLGAALIIHSGAAAETRAARFLSAPPMRFIGLISYSLYLWHYPVRVAYIHIWGKPDFAIQLALILLSFALATLSWRYIETPFRRGAPGASRYPVFAAAAIAMVVVAVAAAPLGPANRVVRNESPQVTALLNLMTPPPETARAETAAVPTPKCMLSSQRDDFSAFDIAGCLALKPGRKNVLVVGDSHAAHLMAGLREVYPEVNFLMASASGCRPILGGGGRGSCLELMNYVFNQFLPANRLDAVIMGSRWRARNVDEMKQTAMKLRDFTDRVIVFGPIVEYRMALPRVLALTLGDKTGKAIAGYRNPEQEKTDRAFAQALKGLPVEYVSVYGALCAPECTVWLGDRAEPIQFDYGHLTAAGSAELVRRIKGQLFPEMAAAGVPKG
ncbi:MULTISPECIES: acyltransferase family protein [Rhodomicrobium]|uniref:acyltransferase family protein n=1 Tax=Rhodomicrobium TaxID=1068 RepID=UPI000B4BA06D|nr:MULTISPECIES: acyltransferase family protein [Rhodomicrobium]